METHFSDQSEFACNQAACWGRAASDVRLYWVTTWIGGLDANRGGVGAHAVIDDFGNLYPLPVGRVQ